MIFGMFLLIISLISFDDMLLFYNVKGSHHSHLKPHVADKY